ARTLAHPDTVLALLAARSPEQVVALAALDAIELPSQLTVRDVMTPQAITVGPERTLGDVARLMVEHDIRALPVVDDAGSLIGMITHRELLRFLIPHFVQRTKTGEFHAPTRSQLQRGSADPQLIPAKEAMARSVLCLAEDQTLADVANLMSSKDVDRFPVVREGVVVGFLTRADVVRRLIAPCPFTCSHSPSSSPTRLSEASRERSLRTWRARGSSSAPPASSNSAPSRPRPSTKSIGSVPFTARW